MKKIVIPSTELAYMVYNDEDWGALILDKMKSHTPGNDFVCAVPGLCIYVVHELVKLPTIEEITCQFCDEESEHLNDIDYGHITRVCGDCVSDIQLYERIFEDVEFINMANWAQYSSTCNGKIFIYDSDGISIDEALVNEKWIEVNPVK